MEVVGAVASFIAIGQAIAVIPKFVQFVRDVSDPSKELLELVKELERLQQYHYFTSEAIGAFSNADLANGSLPDVPIPPYIKMIWQDMVDLMHQLEEHLVGYGEGQKLSTTKRIRQMKWLQTPKDTKRLQERCAKITRELEGAMTIYALSVQKAHYEITVSAISSARRSTLSVVDSSEPMLAEAPGINPRNELQAKPCKPDDTSETQTPDRIPTQPVRRNLVRETIRSKCECCCHSPRLTTNPLSLAGFFINALGFSIGRVRRASPFCTVCYCSRKAFSSQLRCRIPLLLSKGGYVEAKLTFGPCINVSMSLRPLIIIQLEDDCISAILDYDILKREGGIRWWTAHYGLSITDMVLGSISILELLMTSFRYWPLLLQEIDSIVDMIYASHNEDVKRLIGWCCRDHLTCGDLRDDEYYLFNKLKAASIHDGEDDLQWDIFNLIRNKDDLSEIMEHMGSDLVSLSTPSSDGLLHAACAINNSAAAKTLLLCGADKNLRNLSGQTPLHIACKNGSLDCVKLLLSVGGCLLDTVDSLGTPLIHAAMRAADHFRDTTLLLLSQGLSLHARTSTGESIAHNLYLVDPTTVRARVAFLVDNGAADLLDSTCSTGETPIYEAIVSNGGPFLAALLEFGASPSKPSIPGEDNILITLAIYGHWHLLAAAVNARISGIDIRSRGTPYRQTPLSAWRYEQKRCLEDSKEKYGLTRVKHRMLPDPEKDLMSLGDRRMLSHMPGSQSEITFGELLADIRDREIQHEAARLEDIIRLIQLGQTTSARENLQEIRARKLEAGILEEAETFRVVDLQLQDDMAEPAIESLEEFIEVSRARLAVHPFCEEQNDPIYYQDHRRTCENCRDPNELLCDTESDTDESDIEPEDESENESDDESD